MSQFLSNIDEQLLDVAKQTVDLSEHHSDLMGSSQLDGTSSTRQSPSGANPHQFQHHHMSTHEFYSEHEYNLHLPDPIVDQKLKIYPVAESTLTNDGNLITRPYPELLFSNRDELNDFIQEFARENGFGVVIAHSNKKAIYYTCELGGRYRHKKTKREELPPDPGFIIDPNTKTKKLRCPFAMTASFKKLTGVWTLRTTCNEHNHPQLDPLSNHPMLRKRLDELNLLILDLYKVGTKPLHIETKIKEQFPDVLIKREDIYNEIRGYKRKLKKRTQRFEILGKKSAAQTEEETAAAVEAAANAFLENDSHHWSMQSHHQQQQQDEFQRQLQEAGASHIDDSDARFYYENNDGSGSILGDNADLAMENIDLRLVPEWYIFFALFSSVYY